MFAGRNGKECTKGEIKLGGYLIKAIRSPSKYLYVSIANNWSLINACSMLTISGVWVSFSLWIFQSKSIDSCAKFSFIGLFLGRSYGCPFWLVIECFEVPNYKVSAVVKHIKHFVLIAEAVKQIPRFFVCSFVRSNYRVFVGVEKNCSDFPYCVLFDWCGVHLILLLRLRFVPFDPTNIRQPYWP